MPRSRLLRFGVPGVLALMLVIAGAYFLDPECRLKGWVRGELWFAGRPESAWFAHLQSPDDNTRTLAEERLRRGRADAVPILRNLLRKQGPAEVRWRAADALGQIGSDAREAGPELIQALQDPDPYVQTAATRALGKLAPDVPGAVPALSQRFPDIEAIRAIAEYGPQASEAVPGLSELMMHSDPMIRRNAARTLGRVGPASAPAIPALVKCLNDPEPPVREYAAKALGAIGPKASTTIPNLEKLLQDPDYRVRQGSVQALGEIGPLAVGVLAQVQTLKNDPEKEVRKAAEKAERLIDPARSQGREGRTPQDK